MKNQTLSKVVAEALTQIEMKNYAVNLETEGMEPKRIKKYRVAFEEKKVLIGE